jgi:hypothetical protein
MDNTNVQNYWNRGSGSGQLGTTLGVEAIAEYQVLTNTYSAQFGGNGVAINAITKSGTNQWHGSLFEYYRNDRFDASNYFDTAPRPARSDAREKSVRREFWRSRWSGQGVLLRHVRGVASDDRSDPGHQRAGCQRAARHHQRRERRRPSSIAPVLQLYPLPTRQTPRQALRGSAVSISRTKLRRTRTISSGASTTRSRTRTNLFVATPATWHRSSSRIRVRRFRCGTATTTTSNHYVTAELRQIVKSTCGQYAALRSDAHARRVYAHGSRQRAVVFFPGRMSGTVNPGSALQASAAIRCCRSGSVRPGPSSRTTWCGAPGALAEFGVEYERQTTFVDLPCSATAPGRFPA